MQDICLGYEGCTPLYTTMFHGVQFFLHPFSTNKASVWKMPWCKSKKGMDASANTRL